MKKHIPKYDFIGIVEKTHPKIRFFVYFLSKAQQSCVPATALEQSTKNQAKRSKIVEHLIKKRAKHQPET